MRLAVFLNTGGSRIDRFLVYLVSLLFSSEALKPEARNGGDSDHFMIWSHLRSTAVQPFRFCIFRNRRTTEMNRGEQDLTEEKEENQTPESTHQLRGRLFRLHMHINNALRCTRHGQDEPSLLIYPRLSFCNPIHPSCRFSLDPSRIKSDACPSAVSYSL